MAGKNEKLGAAKTGKNDEFYTQYIDIAREMQAYIDYNPDVFRDKTILLPCDDPEWSNFTKYFALNFEEFGIKKLLSTSFASKSKNYQTDWKPSLFETENPLFNADKTEVCGKIFVLERDINGDNHIDINDLEWQYLEGTGDFRSEEVTHLRDEADIIITNPPFSLFREFLAWILEGNKQCVIMGNINAITYKEVFPLIRDNTLWFGPSISSGDREFKVPNTYPLNAAGYRVDDDGNKFIRVKGVRWFTNLEHGRRHQPMQLMTMRDNVRYSKHKEVRNVGYAHYDNYDAIDVPYSDAIPSDYTDKMGVPVSFLDKYCPEQFEIIGSSGNVGWLASDGAQPMGKDTIKLLRENGNNAHVTANMTSLYYIKDGVVYLPYFRIIIRKKQ